VIAFKDFRLVDGIMGSDWSGLDNFRRLFGGADFPLALRNTVTISLLRLCFGFFAPIALALMLNEIRVPWFKRTIQTVTYIPYFLSWVILGGIFLIMFAQNGPVNQLAMMVGVEPVEFLTNDFWFIVVIIVTGIWQAAGQIDVAVRRGVAPAEAGVMFAAFVVAFVASAGVVGGGLVLVDTTWWVRVGAATGLLGGSILLAGDFPSTIARRLPRLGASGDRVRVSWRAVLGFLGYFLGQGSAALVLTYGLTDQWVWPVGPAYAVAWAIGFLVAPVPAGVGIREAALLLLLSSSLVDDAVLAMSILLRAAAIAGELLVIVSGAVARRYVRTDAGMP